MVIYNSRSELGKPAEVFWELPIDGRGWWVKMSSDDSAYFLGRVIKIVDSTENA